MELCSYAEDERKKGHSSGPIAELATTSEKGVNEPTTADTSKSSSPRKRGPAPFQHLQFVCNEGLDEIQSVSRCFLI